MIIKIDFEKVSTCSNLTIVKTVNLNKRDNTVKARITSQEMATSEGSQCF